MKRLFHLFRPKNIWKTQKCFIQATAKRQVKTKTSTKKQSSKQIPVHDGRYLVTMLTGAGLGPELMSYVQDVFCHAEVPVDFESIHATSMEDVDCAILSIKRNRTAIKSSIESIMGDDGKSISPNVYMRNNLDLYLSMVRYQPYCNLAKARHNDVNIILMRQNTEGEYSLLEHESVQGVVESLKIITRTNSERIAKKTFEYASENKRKKVTVVTKANIMKLSDGLFLKQAQEVAKQFPGIKQNAMLIDNCCMQLVSNPKQFDVLMMPNLYGSIVVNIMCGLLGGPGLFAGSNYGEDYAVFEPAARKMGRTLAGENTANPVAMLNASIELLYHLGLTKYATLFQKAIYKTLCEDKVHTPDLGGTNSSTDVVEQIKENIDFFSSEQNDE